MADPTLADLQLFYTGGGSNSTPALSIGGAISSARILSQLATGLTTLTGVVIDDALGNTEGSGTLSYNATTTALTWQPPLGSTGPAVNVSGGGRFFIQGAAAAGGVCVTVNAVALPTSNVNNSIVIANRTQQFFANQSKAESDAGVNKYHGFAIKNNHATDPMVDITLWVAENTPGADTCLLYLDPLAASNGATGPTAVANENTSPVGATFVTPTSPTHASALNVGTLTAGQVRFFWVHQLTPAGITTKTEKNTFKLGLYMRA
jgi:hypothetical protein